MKKIIFLIITVVFITPNFYSQSDDCASAPAILETCFWYTGTNAGYTVNSGVDDTYNPSDICALSLENTAWYSFTPTVSTTYDIIFSNLSCTGGGGAIQAGILAGSCGGPYTSLGCETQPSGNNCFEIAGVSLTAGTTYFIVNDGDANAQCTWEINICPTTCAIPPDIGTFVIDKDGVPLAGPPYAPIYLCAEGGGDCYGMTSNNDYVLPPSVGCEISELMWLLYTGPPTNSDPALDPNYSGNMWTGENFADCNPSAYGLTGTIYFVPVTADDGNDGGNPNGVVHYDQDGDGCFDLGINEAVQITYLNPIAVSTSSNTCTGTVSVTVTGGMPEFAGGNYTVVNNSNGTLAGLPVTHGGNFQITNLTNGDGWSVTISDANGCSNTFTGTYSGDATNPSITCPSNITVNTDAGNCTAVVNYATPVGTDNCPSPTTVQTAGLPSGATFPIGTTTNTFEVTDGVGNTASCSFTVTVVDNEAPTINCPSNITVNTDAGNCTAVVNYTAPVGTDNCPGATTTQIAGLPSGSTFPIGVTTITFEVTDGVGNTNSCSFTVTVNDNEDPVITCPSDIAQCDPVVTFTTPVGTDNCSGVTTTQIAGLPSGSTFPVGVTVNTFEVEDASGNTSTCSFNVEIYPQDDASFTYSTGTYCLTGTDPVAIPSGTQTSGGTYTISSPGVINAADGTIDLDASGLGTYTVTYNTFSVGNPCPDTATFNISITSAPSAEFSYDQLQYCQDSIDPVLTYGAGASGGVFSSTPVGLSLNTGTGAIDLSTSASGLYTVYNTIAAAGGCAAATDSTTIEVLPTDSATFSYSSNTYCVTGVDPAAVSGSSQTSGGTYTISSPGVINAADGTIDLDASGVGTFTVYYNTASAGNSCPALDSVSISITTAPDGAFSYDQLQYCQDSIDPVLTYGAGASGGVFSSTPAGLSLNTGTGAIDLSTSASGLYTVYNTIAAAGGCATEIDSTTIEVLPTDSATFSYSSNTYCVTGNDPTPTLGVNTAPGGTFSITSTITLPGVIDPTDGTIDLSASGTGTFTVYYNTASAGTPCPAIDSVTINIVNSPGATFSYNTPFCEGDTSTVLPTFSGNNFAGVFSSNPTGVSFVDTLTGEIDLTTSNAGTYTIYNNIPAIGGCAADVDSFQIVINPMYIIPENESICAGDSIMLGGEFQTLPGVYSDTLSTVNGCDSIVQTTLTIIPVDTVQIDTAICQGDSLFVGGNWQTVAGIYYDTTTNVSGCDSILVTNLTIDSKPIVQAMNDTIICSGSLLSLTATTNGSGTIEWYSDASLTNLLGTGSPLTLPNPGVGIQTYYVIENGGACPSDVDSVTVTIGGVVANITATPSTGAIPLDVTLDGTASTGNVTSYDWNLGDGNTSNQPSINNIYTDIGTYTVTLIVSDGICSDTATVVIDAYGESAIIIPNVFTPNGDGNNDLFRVDGVNLKHVEGEIYNRWGQKMFSWDNVNGTWDGKTLAGVDAADGTYFYIIRAEGFDGKEYFKKGTLTLIR